MRRFSLTNLRDYGMGKKAAEEKIIEEIQYLVKMFERHEGNSSPALYYAFIMIVYCLLFCSFLYLFVLGKPFNVTKPINYAVSNIISSIIFGSRFDYSDAEFTCMVDRANDNIRLSGSPSLQVPFCISLNKL